MQNRILGKTDYNHIIEFEIIIITNIPLKEVRKWNLKNESYSVFETESFCHTLPRTYTGNKFLKIGNYPTNHISANYYNNYISVNINDKTINKPKIVQK